jgi:hypothetical protein
LKKEGTEILHAWPYVSAKQGSIYEDLPYINHAALTPPCTSLLMELPLQATKLPAVMVLLLPLGLPVSSQNGEGYK